MGPDAMILVFWMLSFKPGFSLSFFTFIKRFFSSSLLSAIRVVSSSPAFLMMYSACKLNKQGDNVQPWCAPLPIWNESVVLCPVLTVASWPAYRFLRETLKTFKETGILTCLLRNLYTGQEAIVRTRHGTTDWFKTGKGVIQGCILSPAYLNHMQSTSGKMPGWMKHKLESGVPGETSTASDIQMIPL